MPGLDGNAITGGTFLEKRKSIVHLHTYLLTYLLTFLEKRKSIVHRHCLWVRRSPLRLDT